MRRILSIDEVRDFRHNESGAWIGANKLDVESIDDPQIPARRNFTLLARLVDRLGRQRYR